MRFYGLTDQDCLKMPYRRFIALHRTIRILQIEEETRAVLVAHQSKPREFLNDLRRELMELTDGRSAKNEKPVEINHVITRYEQSEGGIAAERHRQEQAAAKLAALREQYGGHIPPDVLFAELARR